MSDAIEKQEIRELVLQMEMLVGQLKGRVFDDETSGPVLSSQDAARVENVGEVAHRHLSHLEQHGDLTLQDSLRIRRELYGENIRSTANLFGKKNSGALFYREVEYGTPPADDQPVRLTDEGRRIADLWRKIHLPD